MRSFSFKELILAGAFLTGAIAVIWALMISPHDYQWTEAGETSAVIETILPSRTLIGQSSLKAVVELKNGGKTIVSMPMNPNLKKGHDITLIVLTDDAGSGRLKYIYKIRSKT